VTKAGSIPPNSQAIAERFSLDNVKALPSDASSRQYFRGTKDGKSVVVMLYPRASSVERIEIKAFLDKSDMLTAQGIKVAKCYDVDEHTACALLEDLGERSFGACLRGSSESPEKLYTMATQALIQMRDIKEFSALPLYKQTRIYANRRQIIDYYMAYKLGEHPDESCVDEFHAIWDMIETSLPPCPQGFVHGDYHLENLMFAKGKEGDNQCAVIDHQDAFYGPLPYDLVNLLEDARIDVPQDIRADMIQLYTQNMSADEKENFMVWYTVLAAQFHGRVIGLFIKFAAEQNRDSYLIHIPRLQKYITESLKNPVLKPLNEWFKKVRLDFNPVTPLDGDHVRATFK
jgi:hypothetical protein